MKKTFLKFASCAAMFAVAALSLTACSDDEAASNDFSFAEVDGEYHMAGYIYSDVTLDASETYRITGPVVVMKGGSLTVPAGMTITAEPEFSSYILVAQGGKMYVNGTASAPVTFTSTNGESNWGGLVINGYAPISGELASNNTAGAEISTSYKYGGTNASDNSGSYTYMILDKTGAKSSASVEHNGLTLNGVGNGTVIENVYVLATADDGVEFFGGSVNVTNLLVVNSDDDMFDFTQGYTGTLTNCYGIWEDGFVSTEGDPRGVEADGNYDGLATDTDNNQSDFTIAGMTICIMSTETSNIMNDAIKVRRGATATITNALLCGVGSVKDLIDMVDSKGDGTEGSSISLTSTLTGAVSGSEVVTSTGTTYDDVKVEDGNTGADASVFTWTGYSFPTL
ncbi:MAG: hypothetical protein SNH35_04895 [Rikenellaceae bacterium]